MITEQQAFIPHALRPTLSGFDPLDQVMSPPSIGNTEAGRGVAHWPRPHNREEHSRSLVLQTLPLSLRPSWSPRLFKAHPETLDKFEKFKNLKSEDDMKGSEDLKKHGCTVLTALGSILKKKGQHAAEIQPLAQSHATKHKIPVKYLEVGGHSAG